VSVHEHSSHGPTSLKIGVITASDTRTPETDESGKLIKELLASGGHKITYYEIIPDEPERISNAIRARIHALDAIVISGGTGISARDSTYEAVEALLEKRLDGFGELFRTLSYQEIGSAAFLSRAVAGIYAGKIVVSLPGSVAACRLGLEKLLIPELGHMAHLLKLG
jgi:molybdenum cofactor biosynthesis protein B